MTVKIFWKPQTQGRSNTLKLFSTKPTSSGVGEKKTQNIATKSYETMPNICIYYIGLASCMCEESI
jgi:hypothetical protein